MAGAPPTDAQLQQWFAAIDTDGTVCGSACGLLTVAGYCSDVSCTAGLCSLLA